MLTPIATPHPLLMIGSPVLVLGMLVWDLHTGFQRPNLIVTALVAGLLMVICLSSRSRRAKDIEPRGNIRRPERATLAPDPMHDLMVKPNKKYDGHADVEGAELRPL